jgi:hypothetical protein
MCGPIASSSPEYNVKTFRILTGLLFWCGALALLCVYLTGDKGWSESATRQCISDVWNSYFSLKKLQVRLPESCTLSAGDPIYAANPEGTLRQVGIILQVPEREGPFGSRGTVSAQAVLFPSAPPLHAPVQVHYLTRPDSIAWVIETLLPPERRREIEEELSAAFDEHQQEILKALQPVVNSGLHDALAVLKEDLKRALEKHGPQLQAIAAKDKEEILKRDLLPLLKSEIWPIVRRDSEPLLRQITGELWERVSIWSLAWRGASDKMPLLRGRNRLESELLNFLDREAVPIFRRHEEDFLVLLETITRDVAANDRLKAEFRETVAKVAADPELQKVLDEVFHEVIIENPRFWQSLRQSLSTAQAQHAFRIASARMEPTIQRIGLMILGSRETGLTPEFNQVLRHQVLLKDWHALIVGDLSRALKDCALVPLEAALSNSSP